MNNAEELVIRKVGAQNFEEFLCLIDKLAEFGKLAPPDLEAKKRLWQDCISEKPKYKAYLGTVDGKGVAYIIYFFTYSSFLALPTLYLEDIFVLEEYRRQGVGERLFGFVKDLAKREGCGRIEFTVLKWNTNAQDFYEKNGAKRLEWHLYRLTQEDF